jgi:integrase/recombinase XerD
LEGQIVPNSKTKSIPPTNKGETFDIEPLTKAEVRALIAAASNRSAAGIRLRALIAVLSGAGLRINEAVKLMPRDINTARCTIYVRHGKAGRDGKPRPRTVGLDQESCALVDLWLARRQPLGLTGRHTVFATYSKNAFGQEMDQRYARRALAKLGERAGIEKRVHPHGLRHTLASAMVDDREPLHIIAAQLGHASTATTDRYLRRIAPRELIDRMTSRKWIYGEDLGT